MKKIAYIEHLEEWVSSFGEPSYETAVRFCETDMFGHLNNTVSLVYFEMARIRFFQQLGLMEDWTNPLSDVIPVVADLQCDFIRQIYFDEELKVYVKVNKIGNSSIDLHYMVQNGEGQLCLTGRGAVVQISKKTGKGVSWTEEIKERFAI